MNVLYEFGLGHNAAEGTQNICFEKSEGTPDHSTVTSKLKKFSSICKNPDDQVDSETVLPAIETNPASKYSYSVRGSRHITVQNGLSPLQLQKKHPDLLDFASRYQNIAKLLTRFRKYVS